MENDTPVIEIKDLSRRYGKTDAVNGLSLTVQTIQDAVLDSMLKVWDGWTRAQGVQVS